jgi:hypothetical protein
MFTDVCPTKSLLTDLVTPASADYALFAAFSITICVLFGLPPSKACLSPHLEQ